ncbi:rhomboid-like protein [Mycobacterium sp.]|uniref:rhomboid-like protein n=1 Tax=Mycobacterium sp. TaxID=1785 RepID=UPI0031D229FE
MLIAFMSRLARVRFTVGYASILAAVSTALVVLGPRVRAEVVRDASTNLHNLAHGNLGSLFGSAFVTDAGPIYVWLPGLMCLLALAELIWCSGRLTVVFVTGHLGATLVVAAGLTTAVKLGWMPLSISRASDVGMSYGAVAVLGALSAAVPRRWRPAWLGWWVPVGITAAVVGTDFTDAGHSVALLLGMLVSTRFGQRPASWTTARYLMLAVASVFGFFLLNHTGWAVLVGVGAGAVGAVAADRFTRSRRVRRELPAPAAAAAVPALNC